MSKQFLKKNKCQIILIGLVLYLTIAISFYHYFLNGDNGLMLFAIFLIILFVLVCFITPFLFKVINEWKFIRKSITFKQKWMFYLLFLVVSLIFEVIVYMAFCPGYWANDNIYQYRQASTNQYNDWHPYFHTLLFYKIPMLITGNHLLIVPFQLLLFAMIFAFLLETVYEFSNKWVAIVSFIIVMCNPNVIETIISPMKDAAYAITVILISLIAFRIYSSNFKRKIIIILSILLGILLAFSIFFRHNGIFFVIPMVVGMFFIIEKKEWIIMISVLVLCSFVIKVPLFNSLNVEQPGNRNIESFSSSIAIIGEIAKEDPEALDSELQEFIFSVAPKKLWDNNYECGNILSVKYERTFHSNIIEQKSIFKLCAYTLRAFFESPSVAFNTLFKLQRNIFCVDLDSFSKVPSGIYPNKYKINYCGFENLMNVFINYFQFVYNSPLAFIFCCLGIIHLFLLICIFSKCKLNTKDGLKKILLCMPVFIYDYFTSLIWACSYSWTTEGRYFFATWVIWPLILIICFYDKNGTTKKGTKNNKAQ